VAQWVYNVGSEKPSATSGTDIPETATHQTNVLFSLLDWFNASPTPALNVPEESINLLEATLSNIVLTIFAVNVDVQLDEKMTAELRRSTLKNPPSREGRI